MRSRQHPDALPDLSQKSDRGTPRSATEKPAAYKRHEYCYFKYRIARKGKTGALRAFRRNEMLHWSLVFLVIALIAAVLGFGGIAGAAAGIAKILFFVFLVIWLIAFITGRRAV